MKSIVETINESVTSSKDIVSELSQMFQNCETREEYKEQLRAIGAALYKMADNNYKIKRSAYNAEKKGEDAELYKDKFYAATQLLSVVDAINREITEYIKDEKYWKKY